jgi:hypothetical protein
LNRLVNIKLYSIDYLKTKNNLKKRYKNTFNNLKEKGLLFEIDFLGINRGMIAKSRV